MKNKASKILDIICTTVIMFLCYIMGWMTLPTISALPEQTQISSEVLKWLYDRYLDNEELYIITMLFITAILSYILYSGIKKVVQMKYSNVYKKNKIQNVYTDFMKDAKKLYIIGGDLDFFNEAKVQFEKVKALGNNCKILCSKSNKEETKDLYKNLSDAGVELKVYSRQVNESLKNVRGQIKISTTGNQECLFVNRQEVKSKTEYEVVAMQNKYFTEVMRNLFNQTFEQAHNPLIKLICFDMGGVYFDGDFNDDFLEVINGYLSKNIRANHKQKLILDEELNLGKKNIIDWVEDKVGKSLTLEERNFVEETWKKVWKPNEKMKRIAQGLKDEGYEIGVFSNMDQINGDMYKERGDFSQFSPRYIFLSYEIGETKPHRAFYQKILTSTGLEPHEILLIDDHEDNIIQAEMMNFHTLHFSIQNGHQDLINKLRENNILISETTLKE